MKLNEVTYTPCYSSDEVDRLIFYTERRIDREYYIWKLYVNKTLTFKQIGMIVGCSESVAGFALRRILAIGSDEKIVEYFKVAFDFYDILEEFGGNPDRQLNYIMNALLRAGICKKTRIKNLTIKQLEDFLGQKDLHNAGKKTKEAFREYRYRLKHHKQYYKEKMA